MQGISVIAKTSAILVLATTLTSCGAQQTTATAKRSKVSVSEKLGEDFMEGQGLYLSLPLSALPAGADMVRVSLEPEISWNEADAKRPTEYKASTGGWGGWERDSREVPEYTVALPSALNYEPYYFEFSVKDKILMKDIRTGNYFVRIEILNSNTGLVNAEGSGTAKIVADKVSTAKIKMTKISRGGVEIVLEI